MTELLLDKPTQLLKGKVIKDISLCSDCIGDIYVITFEDKTELHINYNEERDFWLDIMDGNKCLMQIGIGIIDKVFIPEMEDE